MNVAAFLVLAVCVGVLVGISGYAREIGRRGWSTAAWMLGLVFIGVAVWMMIRAIR